MFRAMRRAGQALDRESCIALLKGEKRGVLSLLGDDGYPYGIPMNHWCCEEDGRLYFHGAREGHKLDALRACDKVSYCVFGADEKAGEGWALRVQSVVVFGRIAPVEDEETRHRVCRELCRKFTPDAAYARAEWEKAGGRVLCLALTPEHITGKSVREA